MSKEQKGRSGSSRNPTKKKPDPESQEKKTNGTLVDASTLERLEGERDEYYDRLLRTQAEFDNYRKRMGKEKVDLRMESQSAPIRELLPVLDACEKGLENLSNTSIDPQLQPYYEGYELLLTQLKSVLARFEVEGDPGYRNPIRSQCARGRPQGIHNRSRRRRNRGRISQGIYYSRPPIASFSGQGSHAPTG